MGRIRVTKVVPLLRHLMRDPASTVSHTKVQVKHDMRTKGGTVFDDFSPRKETSRVVVAVHGVTVEGKDDPRLQHFARCLALSGIRCVVPTLPELARLRWDVRDIGRISNMVDHVAAEGPETICLVGFSFGASYALVAAAERVRPSPIRLVLAFGAYHSLVDLYDHFRSWVTVQPTSDEEEDAWIYLNLVMAHRHRAALGLSAETAEVLALLLHRYCNEASAEEKRAFYDAKLAGSAVIGSDVEPVESAELAMLSPEGRLSALSCPIGLVHDRTDSLVPWEHSQRIFDELTAATPGLGHRLVVTSLLQHVRPTKVLELREGIEMMRLVSMLWD